MTTGSTTLAAAEAAVRAALAERYAVPVVRERAGRIEVPSGGALTLARDALADAGIADVEVAPLDLAGGPWHAVPDAGLELWRAYGVREEMVTQLAHGDPAVQVVAEHDGWQLVRTLDGAQGWLAPDATLGGETQMPTPGSAFDVDAFVREALALLGAPYVWGGTSRAGVDCSGLVQRAAWSAAQVWLPRHSTALLHVGERVAPKRAARGDVLVLKRMLETVEDTRAGFARRHPMHVAVLEDDVTTIHASRDACEVVREPLATLRERYRVLGVRRLAR